MRNSFDAASSLKQWALEITKWILVRNDRKAYANANNRIDDKNDDLTYKIL